MLSLPRPGRVLKWLALGFVLAAMLLAAGLASLQFSGPRKALTRQASEWLSSSLEIGVELEGLEELSLNGIQLDSIRLSDLKGVWLEASGIEFVFDISQLAHSPHTLGAMKIDRIRMERNPVYPATESSPEPFSDLPPMILGSLQLPRVELGAAVAGQSLSLSAEGSLRMGAPGHLVEVAVKVDRTDTPGLQFSLSGNLDRVDGLLVVSAELNEAPGGPIGQSIGIPPSTGLRAALTGKGPLQDWKGELTIRGAGLMEADLDTRFAAPGSFELTGQVRNVRHPEVLAAGWSAAQEPLEVSFELERDRMGNVTFEAGRAAIPGVTIEGRGKTNLTAGSMEAILTLESPDVTSVQSLVAVTVSGGLRVDGKVRASSNGLLASTWTVRLEDYAAGPLSGALQTAVVILEREETGKWTFAGKGSLESPELDGQVLPTDGSIDWNGLGDLSPTSLLQLQEFQARSPALSVRAGGRGRLDGRDLDGRLEVDVSDLGSLNLAEGSDLGGKLRLTAGLSGSVSDEDVGIDLRGWLSDLKPLPAPLVDRLRGRLDFKGSVRWRGSTLAIQTASVKGVGGSVRTSGSVNLKGQTVDLSWELSAPALEARDQKSDLPWGTLKGVVRGPWAAPVIQGTAVLKDAPGQSAASLNGEFQIHADPLRPRGKLSATVTRGLDSLKARMSVQGDRNQFIIEPLDLVLEDGKASGRLVLDRQGGFPSGGLSGNFTDLGSLGRLAGTTLSGQAAFKVSLKGASPKREGSAQIDLTADTGPIGAIESGKLTVSIRDLPPSGPTLTDPVPETELRVQLNGLAGPGIFAESVTGQVQLLSGDSASFRFQSSGTAGATAITTYVLKADGSTRWTSSTLDLTLAHLSGTVAGKPVSLRQPARFIRQDQAIRLRGFRLSLAEGQLSVDFTRDEELNLTAQAERLPLTLLTRDDRKGPQGRVNGRVDLAGPPSAPSGTFEVQVVDLRLPAEQGLDLKPVQARLQGRVTPGSIQGQLSMSGLTSKSVRGQFQFPLRLDLQEGTLESSGGSQMSGSLLAEAELSEVSRLLQLDLQRLLGSLAITLSLAGTPDKPVISGSASLARGRYENSRTGTLLDGLDVRLQAKGEKLILERATGTDGGRGRVSATGTIGAEAKAGFPLAMVLNLQSMRLVRRDDLEASVDGSLRVIGSLEAPHVSGSLKIGPARVRIPEQLPADVVEIDVIEVGGPARPDGASATEGRAASRKIGLDVKLHAPRQVFVRGRGVESEWKADLRITGTTIRPILAGSLSLIRGKFEFAGKTFNLTRGSISFTGKSPPEPTLDLQAEVTAVGIVAKLGVTGSFERPRIALSSDPEMPQDEVLSRLLFGKTLNKISPTQALALGEAVQTMYGGGGGGPGILGRAKDSLGLDLLDVGRSVSGKSAVGIGKYIQDGVFVEVEQSLGTEGSRVSVEADLGSGLTVKTSVDEKQRTGVGLNWRRDY